MQLRCNAELLVLQSPLRKFVVFHHVKERFLVAVLGRRLQRNYRRKRRRIRLYLLKKLKYKGSVDLSGGGKDWAFVIREKAVILFSNIYRYDVKAGKSNIDES